MHVRAEAAAAVAVAGEQCTFPEDAEELEQRSSSCYTQLGLSGTNCRFEWYLRLMAQLCASIELTGLRGTSEVLFFAEPLPSIE